jgi:hypothetical protein
MNYLIGDKIDCNRCSQPMQDLDDNQSLYYAQASLLVNKCAHIIQHTR